MRPKDLTTTLGPLLPERYSQIHPVKGTGNQTAYLAAIPEAVVVTLTAKAIFDEAALQRGRTISLTFQAVTELLDDAVERGIASDLHSKIPSRGALFRRRGQDLG